VEDNIRETTDRVETVNNRIEAIKGLVEQLKMMSEQLKQNATAIKELDVSGMYTRTSVVTIRPFKFRSISIRFF